MLDQLSEEFLWQNKNFLNSIIYYDVEKSDKQSFSKIPSSVIVVYS